MRDLSDPSPAPRPGPDVLFVYLPYGAVERPSIALGLLKQILVDAGHSADVFYPNMDFAERVGIHAYDAISRLSRELVGEADELLPGLVANALAHGPDTPHNLLPEGGLGKQSGTGGREPEIGRARVEDLDATPIPNYSDYFARLARSPLRDSRVPGLLVETSRGCWWGTIKHCTLCGLNGGSLSLRSKTPEGAVEEFRTLAARQNCRRFMVVDNIIDLDYFASVPPEMAAGGAEDYDIFYETKANLRRSQIADLRPAGVTRIQPGIESLHDDLLGLVAKGTTALVNTRLLK